MLFTCDCYLLILFCLICVVWFVFVVCAYECVGWLFVMLVVLF